MSFHLRALTIAALVFIIGACRAPIDRTDAGPGGDAGDLFDGGSAPVCAEVPSSCEPDPGETPLEALDECFVCGRGLCRLSGGEEVCGAYDDPHPVFCAGAETSLPEASAEDGQRPLIVSASVTIAELNRTPCEGGSLWTVYILRVPGAAAVAHVTIDGDPPIVVTLTEQGPLVEDGDARLVDTANGKICLDVPPEESTPFSIQLEDSAERRSPRYCGILEVRVGDDGGD